MTIRTEESRINCKDVSELLNISLAHGKAQFGCIRLFAKKPSYGIVTFGDYTGWLKWFNSCTPQQRKQAYKEWKKEMNQNKQQL